MSEQARAFSFLGVTLSLDRAKSKKTFAGAAVALAVVNALVLGVGSAYAAWGVSGSGTGASVAGSAQGLTLTAATTGSSVLYPGGTSDVVLTITNPNPFVVSVTNLTMPLTAATAYTDSGLTTLNGSCNSGGTGVTWAYGSKSLSGVIVQKKIGATNGTLTLTLTGGASMDNTSDNSCQSAFFKMPNVSTVTAASSTGTPVASISQ